MIESAYKPVLLADLGVEDSAALSHYRSSGGYEGLEKALAMKPEEVTALVKKANLRGRGGAGFPAGVKWGFVPKDKKPRYVACNLDESEPGTFSNRAIARCSPQMFIEGILICARAIEAHAAYIYIRGEMVEEAEILERALDEARRENLLGEKIMGRDFTCEITLHRGAGAYVCGEETGMLSSIEGGRGNPRAKPPFPAVSGLWNSPTVINNAQTLANLPHILRRGADWFLSLGPEGSPGPLIYCVAGHVEKPGLYEHPMTITMRELIYELAGGVPEGRKLKAVIPGGSSMPVFKYDGTYEVNGEKKEDSLDLQLDFDSVQAAGSYLGSAGVIVMDERTDMVRALYNLLRFYEHESCGQCTPCREGTAWLVKIVGRIIKRKGREEDLPLLLDIAKGMSGTTICMLSDSAAMPTESFVTKFRDEFLHYIRNGKSPVAEPIRI